MYLTKKICYLEMMRSGSTHIHKLFKEFIPEGKQIGHHGPASKEIMESDRIFIGSIRNPGSWYLSVWFPVALFTTRTWNMSIGRSES